MNVVSGGAGPSTSILSSTFDVGAARFCTEVVDRLLLYKVSVLTWKFRTQISTDHKMYYTGPGYDMQSTSPNWCMADCHGSNIVVLGTIW